MCHCVWIISEIQSGRFQFQRFTGIWCLGDARDALVGHYTRAKVAVQHDRGAFGNCQNVAVVKECLKKKV